MTPLNSLHRVSQSLTQSVSHDVFLSGGSRGTSVSQFVQVVGQIWFLEIVALRFPLHLELLTFFLMQIATSTGGLGPPSLAFLFHLLNFSCRHFFASI